MKLKANYKLDFKLEKKKYKKYHEGYLFANIIINKIKTNYYIRSDGTVFSKNFCKKGKLKKLNCGKIRNLKDHDNPYRIVHLSVKNNSFTVLLHRLVALAFIYNPDPKNKTEVNHLDGDKSNNDMSNLEWSTSSENISHSYNTGIRRILYGEERKNTKITKKQAKRICELLEKNQLTMKEIAKEVGCSKNIVDNIRHRLAWVSVSSQYKIDNYNVRESTNGNKRLTKDVAIKICEELSSGYYSIREISERYNVRYSCVNDIKQRKTWGAVSKPYDFSNYNKYKK